MKFIKFLFLLFIFNSCDEGLLDTLNKETDFNPDASILSGPINGSTINDNTATFVYSGSNEFVSEFSHRLTRNSIENEWSDWAEDTIATYEYLDEGDYKFEVRGSYSQADALQDTLPDSRLFTVDAVSSSSLRVYPQY